MSDDKSSNASDEGDFGGMFANEEEDREQERLQEERNKRVDLLVPRYIPSTSEQQKDDEDKKDTATTSYVESPNPLVVRHRPGNHHSLWGHLLWNAGRHIVYLMDSKKIDVRGKSVIELGCGVAAPSFVAALNGARVVCATDYPDEDLLEVVAENAAKVLVLDEETRLISSSSSKNDESNHDDFKNKKLTELFKTPQELEKFILDDRIRDVVMNKSGLKFEQEEENEENEEQKENSNNILLRKRLNFFVQGLCWGNGDHIQSICDKANSNGFDIVFLSDLMFNHICHDQLLATVSKLLARDFNSRAYVVFSFHRVHKKDDDLNFFKKCEFYGLQWKLVEVNNEYPLMFPDDPGDASIRKPVNVYELSLTMETIVGEKAVKKIAGETEEERKKRIKDSFVSAAAAAPIDKFKFDVVVQGTGLVESLVSASCARAGLSVLHLDSSDQYGTGFFSTTSKERFEEFLNKNKLRHTIETPCIDRLEEQLAELKQQVSSETNADDHSDTNEQKLSDLKFSLADSVKILSSRQLNFDAFATPYLAQSSLINAIARSQMGEHIEFQNVHRVVSIQQNNKQDTSSTSNISTPLVSRVPVTRKDVFNSGTSCFSMLEGRRLMRFIQDISNQSALERDTDVHRERHSNEAVAALQEALKKDSSVAEVDLKQTTIFDLLTNNYKFSQNLIDLVTLGGTLLNPKTTSSESAVTVIFNYLMSIGVYSGSTPYLAPMYSASDLSQIFSRMSAVWGTCFALGRSVVKAVHVENTFLKGSGDSYSFEKQTSTSPTPHDVSMPPTGHRLVLDNGQHISAKCFVHPRTFSSTSSSSQSQQGEEFIRAIIVSKKGLITWKALEETCGDKPVDEDDKTLRLSCSEPLCVGYAKLRFPSENHQNSQTSSVVSCSFLQWSDILEQAPNHVVISHLTARRSDLPENLRENTEEFLRLVKEQLFISNNNENQENEELYADWSKHVVLATAFLWGENEAANSCNGGSENSRELEKTLGDLKGAKNDDGGDDNGIDEECRVHDFPVKTIFGDLNDSLYAEETERVFRQVLRACGRNDDEKEMPIVKGREDNSNSAEEN